VTCRLAGTGDLDLLTEWRTAFSVEGLGSEDGPALRAQSRGEIEWSVGEKRSFVLQGRDGRAVSCASYNARTEDAVQLGGVFTPPSLRRHGHARAVACGALLAARNDGVRLGLLFTGRENEPAKAAYRAIGFKLVGDYGLLLFK
jgi:predicted GNAT family acetyltransferase